MYIVGMKLFSTWFQQAISQISILFTIFFSNSSRCLPNLQTRAEGMQAVVNQINIECQCLFGDGTVEAKCFLSLFNNPIMDRVHIQILLMYLSGQDEYFVCCFFCYVK